MMKTKTFILILVIPAILVLLFLLLFNSPVKAAPGPGLELPAATLLSDSSIAERNYSA